MINRINFEDADNVLKCFFISLFIAWVINEIKKIESFKILFFLIKYSFFVGSVFLFFFHLFDVIRILV